MVDNKSPKEIIIGNLLAFGIEEDVVEAFVAALDPTFVTEVFHLVWDTCNEVNIHINRADIPTQWYDIYQCMLSLEQAELFDGASTGNATVVHGHITDHPIYSTMAYQASWVDAQYRFFYVNLQFLLLCATVSARKTGEAMSDNAIIVSCLLTRQLVRSKHQDILIKLSSLFCNFEPQSGSELSPTIQRFYALNDYLIANKELKFYGAKLHALHTVIAIVVGDQNLKQKRERATGERGLVFREVYGDNEDTQLTIITDTTIDEETEYQSQVIDASAPNEVKSPRVQIKAALPANMPEAWVCSRQIAYRQKGMLNAISRRNQGLVYQVSRLQRGELRTILNNSDKALFGLEETLQHGFATGFGEALDTQLGILLQLITGLPLAKLLDITWVKDNETNQLHIKPITSKDGPMEIAISFVPAKHRLTKIKPEKFKPIVFQPNEYIELNVGDAFYALLKRAFRLKKLQGVVWQQPLLTTPLATLEQNINQQL